MKQTNLILFVLIFFIVSCNSKSGSKAVLIDSAQIEVINDKQAINISVQSDISNVSEKLKKQEKLTNEDYDCICNFLFQNVDESESEEIGYRLFVHFKGNTANNRAFLSYLSNKNTKEKVLKELIRIMCIDIGEENYSYATFVKDFEIFTNSISAKNAYNECLGKDP